MSVKVTDLIPDDAAYDFDESTQIADVTIETHDSEDGRPRWANVFAKLTVAMSHGQPFIEATYVSHRWCPKSALLAPPRSGVETV